MLTPRQVRYAHLALSIAVPAYLVLLLWLCLG